MIRLVEVGPRDGLQNERTPIPTEAKLRFIHALRDAGLREIEATSFVSPKWVPQLGDAAELWPQLPPGGLYSALVPNLKGLERAAEAGVRRIAVFTAASDAFTQKNINMSVEQSLEAFGEVISRFREINREATSPPPAPADAKAKSRWEAEGGQSPLREEDRCFVRGYVSTAFECPYAGRIDPERTVQVAARLIELGADEVSIGDTIGVAAPKEVEELTSRLLDVLPALRIVYHFHDTRGTAIANIAKAFEMGITSFDSAAAGLGGCPYAAGAGGNVATEDVVYFFERSGVSTGVDLARLAQASLPILELLNRPPTAKAQVASLPH
jgi:hydroxymethylglutaryl-CoA lyase